MQAIVFAAALDDGEMFVILFDALELVGLFFCHALRIGARTANIADVVIEAAGAFGEYFVHCCTAHGESVENNKPTSAVGELELVLEASAKHGAAAGGFTDF